MAKDRSKCKWVGLSAALLAAVAGCCCAKGESGGVTLPIVVAPIIESPGGVKTVVVTPSNMHGWGAKVVSLSGKPTGLVIFIRGPGSPPSGAGSAGLFTEGDGSQGVFLSSATYANQPLAGLTALSYSTYAVAWNGQQIPYLKLDLDLDGNGTIDDFIFFEPAYQTPSSGNPSLPDQGAPALNVWQRWNAVAGGWWSMHGWAGATPGSGVKSLAQYLAAFPKVRIVNLPNGDGGVRIVAGLASTSGVFSAYVDAFTIAFAYTGTTYDFEADSPAQ